MQQKAVKLEIGKLVAIIVSVAVIAIVATMVVQGGFFKGQLIEGEKVTEWSDSEALAQMKTDLEKGLPTDTVIKDYLARTGKDVMSDDVMILVKRVDGDLANKVATDVITVNFESDLNKVITDGALPVVTRDVQKDIELAIVDFNQKTAELLVMADKVQKDAVNLASSDFEILLKDSIAGTDLEKDFESYMLQFAKLKDSFMKDIDAGVSFKDALEKHFGTITPEKLGILKYEKDFAVKLDESVQIFKDTVDKHVQASDIDKDFQALTSDFDSKLNMLQSTVPTSDAPVISDFEQDFSTIQSDFSLSNKDAISTDAAFDSFVRDFNNILSDKGFEVIL